MINEIEKVLTQILSANISQEQKEALLGALGDEIINNKVSKREELIEKNRQQASELRERLEEREKESYKKEINKEAEEKTEQYIKELSEVKNNNGEYIYKNLEEEYKNGIISKEEIYNIYEIAFNKKDEVYQPLFDINEKNLNSKIDDEKKTNEDNKKDEIPMENNEEDTVVENDLEKETFRDLTFQEARSIIKYGEMERNGELDETKIIKFKPLIDEWMSQTGCESMQELYDKASEVLRNHPFDIESSTLKKTEFSNKQDVSELNEEEKNYIRCVQQMDDNKEITNDDLHKVQSKLIAKNQEPRKPVKQIEEANDNIKQKINAKDKVIAAVKVAAAIGLVAVAVVGGVTLIPGIAAGALGASAVHQYNKGKKL